MPEGMFSIMQLSNLQIRPHYDITCTSSEFYEQSTAVTRRCDGALHRYTESKRYRPEFGSYLKGQHGQEGAISRRETREDSQHIPRYEKHFQSKGDREGSNQAGCRLADCQGKWRVAAAQRLALVNKTATTGDEHVAPWRFVSYDLRMEIFSVDGQHSENGK